jgi:hypothetical protein
MTIVIPAYAPDSSAVGGMTRLQLCRRLRQEAGISGTGPTTTISQTGEMGKVVDWIDSAYQDIQNLHADWDFLRSDLSFETIATISEYPKTAISATEQGEWIDDSFRSYLTSAGVAGEQFMTRVPWKRFRDVYLLGSLRSTTGQPLFITQQPDTSLLMWPIPDAIYTINGEYFQRPQTMTADSTNPLIPAKYQMIIVWRALMYYAGSAGAPELYAVGQREYKRLLNQLEAHQLPEIEFAGPLE